MVFAVAKVTAVAVRRAVVVAAGRVVVAAVAEEGPNGPGGVGMAVAG